MWVQRDHHPAWFRMVVHADLDITPASTLVAPLNSKVNIL